MTKIKTPCVRETDVEYSHKKLVIALHPKYITLWRKKDRTTVNVDYATVYELAFHQRALASLRLQERENRK